MAADKDKHFAKIVSAFQNQMREDGLVSEELEAQFLNVIDNRDALPENSPKEVVDQFLGSVLSLVAFKPGTPVAERALRILFNLVKGDEQVYQRFQPTRNIVAKLRLDNMINSGDQKEADLGLDFASFILRYYKHLTYSDFSESEAV